MQELQEGFIDYLWKKFQNPNTESVLKKSCVAYMASMMSRAKYFSVELVGEVSMAVVRESGGERGMFWRRGVSGGVFYGLDQGELRDFWLTEIDMNNVK